MSGTVFIDFRVECGERIEAVLRPSWKLTQMASTNKQGLALILFWEFGGGTSRASQLEIAQPPD
eukprot:7237187-Pyramimonas_sp.AAC.1